MPASSCIRTSWKPGVEVPPPFLFAMIETSTPFLGCCSVSSGLTRSSKPHHLSSSEYVLRPARENAMRLPGFLARDACWFVRVGTRPAHHDHEAGIDSRRAHTARDLRVMRPNR